MRMAFVVAIASPAAPGWDVTSATPGVYFCRQTGKLVRDRKE